MRQRSRQQALTCSAQESGLMGGGCVAQVYKGRHPVRHARPQAQGSGFYILDTQGSVVSRREIFARSPKPQVAPQDVCLSTVDLVGASVLYRFQPRAQTLKRASDRFQNTCSSHRLGACCQVIVSTCDSHHCRITARRIIPTLSSFKNLALCRLVLQLLNPNLSASNHGVAAHRTLKRTGVCNFRWCIPT